MTHRQHTSTVIVGSGFGGLAAAIELKRAGYTDITVLERADGVGGVWRDNHYPGAACDVPSVIYSFSYALRGSWSEPFGRQPEIKAYLERIVDKFDLEPHLRLRSEVVAARYDDETAGWDVTLRTGEVLTCDVLIMATGQLSNPRMPEVDGVDTFPGASFHSAQWDHAVDLTGKRVAVVGSGASAIQLVPAIVDQVAELTVVQRSPNWVIRKSKRRHGPVLKTLLRLSSLARRAHHNIMFLGYEARFPLVLRKTAPIRWASELYYKGIIRKHLDPEKAGLATPHYTMMCNRLLLSNDWYPALGRDHVNLVAAGVERVTENGLTLSDGHTVDADVIVWCTGFKASEFLGTIEVTGRHGVRLRDQWAHGAEAYLGISVPNFPNLGMLFGPNTNSITNSIVYMLERQARYVRLLVDELEARPGAFDLRGEVHDQFQSWLRDRLGATVFTDTCPGWYTNGKGKVTAMWPSSHLDYARRTRRFDPADYEYLAPSRQPSQALGAAAAAGHPS